MSRSTYINKTTLVSSSKSGPHLVKISNITKYRNKSGEVVRNNGNTGVVIMFENDEIKHEELYWISGHNYSKLLKLLKLIGAEFKSLMTKHILVDDLSNTDLTIDPKTVVNKVLWIVIRHNVRVVDGKEVKRESELIDFSPEDRKPNYPNLIEEYDIASEDNNEFPEPNF